MAVTAVVDNMDTLPRLCGLRRWRLLTVVLNLLPEALCTGLHSVGGTLSSQLFNIMHPRLSSILGCTNEGQLRS